MPLAQIIMYLLDTTCMTDILHIYPILVTFVNASLKKKKRCSAQEKIMSFLWGKIKDERKHLRDKSESLDQRPLPRKCDRQINQIINHQKRRYRLINN